MSERDDNCEYPWLSEFLCEYVDGTMEPGARVMFEECLRGNPQLADHIARLRCARNVLGDFGCRLHAPCNLHEQLHRRLAEEQACLSTPKLGSDRITVRLNTSALVFSALLLMMLGGATAGSLLLPPTHLGSGRAVHAAELSAPIPTVNAAGLASLQGTPSFLGEDQPYLLPDTLPHSPMGTGVQEAD